MFENHCNSCDSDFDVIGKLKETEPMGYDPPIMSCPYCASNNLTQSRESMP